MAFLKLRDLNSYLKYAHSGTVENPEKKETLLRFLAQFLHNKCFHLPKKG